MSTVDHSRWDDDLAAYALGALHPRETEEFQAHLAGCVRCRTELRWLEPAIDSLPASVDQIEPPPQLRDRILGVIDADAVPHARSGRRRSTRWSLGALRPAMTAAAVALALVAGLAGGYALSGDDDGATVTTVPVRAAGPAIQTSAAVVRNGDSWTLEVEDIPTLRRGDVYQVWLAHGKRIEPSVLFVPSHGNTARVALPRTVASADQIMVTREPAGGSLEPTSAALMQARL
jgi:anti-sigma-K factor RskA